MTHFSTIILGAGPGGAHAARLLAQGGQSVALVEAAQWGGTCLNCGCIPTKMLLGGTAPLAHVHAHKRLRTLTGDISVDYSALQNRTWRFVKGSSQALSKSLGALGITLIQGKGTCTAPGRVEVQDAEGTSSLYTADHCIFAGGSSPAAFPGLKPDHEAVLDSTDLLHLPEVPESLLIIGAGAIGLELGDFFAALGSKITIVEAAPHILPTEDADIAAEMHKILTKAGRVCLPATKAAALMSCDGKAVLTLEDGSQLQASKALVAVGRRPNTEGLNCQSMGCSLNRRGFIEVNACLEAANTVYAVGDINGLTLLAHAAEHQAGYVARRILGQTKEPYASGPIPSCVYGSTEVMRVGVTAKELSQSGEVHVSRAPLSLNAIAQSHGDSSGFVKAVWKGDELMGVAAIGHGVSHLVTAAQLLLHGQYTGERAYSFMFAHPTLDEALATALHAPKEVFVNP